MEKAKLYQLPANQRSAPSERLPLARLLIEQGLATPWQVFYALKSQSQWDASLQDILMARGWISAQDLRRLAVEHDHLRHINLIKSPPNSDLVDVLPAAFCLKHNVLPWARIGGTLILVTGRPHALETLRNALPQNLEHALFAIADPEDINKQIGQLHGVALTQDAETGLASHLSCRTFKPTSARRNLAIGLLTMLVVLICWLFPKAVATGILGWTMLSLMAAASLRVAALVHGVATWKRTAEHAPATESPVAKIKLPRISVMVPLFREKEIATALIHRLTRLTYPRALLEVVLVLEAKDTVTRATIARTKLPKWMRTVEVPVGSGLTTKPRALNYALHTCKGDIIGIWDAEDAPAPDQLEKVAQRFAQAQPEVVCFQGVLDFYNPYTNWLSRCFAIEYAAWFRLMLPGLRRLGFALPLGGTTVFMKRSALEDMGGWDSFNVTEDADLGMRLARHGKQTELLDSVTEEEANCRPIAWVRQRSRWLKGYMATYLVHMRHPLALWRDLGTRQFFGFQILFLCTISQFLLAPLLWMLWGLAFVSPHPLTALYTPVTLYSVTALLLLAGAINGAFWIMAAHHSNRPKLYVWSLSMVFYFPLATLAAYKALIEMVVAPFYWDKTAHGKTKEAVAAEAQASCGL